jgi:hypothetical protein
MNTPKKTLIPFLFALGFILTTVISCSSSTNPPNPPTGTTGLIVSVVTSSAGGGYAPKHVVAIWIEDNAGKFIKTLTVYAQARAYDLTNWENSSAGNSVDAVTGATQSSFGTIYGSWNGTDVSGKVVADGTYKVCMELTDKSSTGNFASFTFTKGTVAQTQTPANVTSFSSVSIKWMPL